MYVDLKFLLVAGLVTQSVIAVPLANHRPADINVVAKKSFKHEREKRFIRPDLILGALTSAAGVYLGTQLRDDTHSEKLIDTVEEKLLDAYDERSHHNNS